MWRGLWKPLIYLSKYLRVDTPSRTYREVLGRSVLEGLVHSPSWLTIPGWSTVTVWHICPGCKRSSRGRLNRYLSGVIQRGFHPEDKLHKCLQGPFHSRILGLWEFFFLFLCLSITCLLLRALSQTFFSQRAFPDHCTAPWCSLLGRNILFPLDQGPVNLVCKGTDSKCFRLCEPNGFCCNYSPLPL